MRRFTLGGRRVGAVAVAMVLVTGCGGPREGDLVLDLTTPNSDDGAVAFSVAAETGLEIMSASAECAGCQLFTEHVGASELRGVIVGDLAAGPFLRVGVSDTKRPSSYTFSFREVASRTADLRVSTAGYSVTVR